MSYVTLSNGASTRKPGVYSQATYIKQGNRNSPGKVPCFIGDFPWLEAATPTLFGSAANMRQAAPINATNLRLSQLIWGASIDSRVSSPGRVYLCNAQPTTAASWTFLDANGDDSLVFTSREFGPIGNSVYVAIAAGTTSGKKYTISRQGMATEVYDDVGIAQVFTAAYGGATANAMTIEAGPASGITFRFTVNAAAIGTWTPGLDLPFDGQLTIDPSAAPGGGQSAAALVTGIKTDGTPTTQTLTWAAGDGAPKVTTASYSAVTSIVFSQTGGYAGTFQIDGDSLVATVADYPYVSNVIDRIRQYTNWTVLTVSARASKIPLDEIDDLTTTSIVGAGVGPSANVWAATQAMAASAICSVTRAAAAVLVPANATHYLVGGSSSTTTLGDLQDAFTALEAEDIVAFDECLMYDDSTFQAEFVTHLNRCWSTVASERIGFTGAPANSTQTAFSTLTTALNSGYLAVAFQSVTVTDYSGATVTLDPIWTALIACSMASGSAAANSLMNKRPNVTEFSAHSTMDADTNYEVLLTLGALFMYHASTGIVWMDDYTSYRSDVDDPFQAHIAPQTSVALTLRRVRDAVTSEIGTEATASEAGRIAGATKTALTAAVAAGDLKAYDNQSVHVEDGGDTFNVTFACAPIETTRFIVLSAAVTRMPSSV